MKKLFILTEERAKISVIKQISELLAKDFKYTVNFQNDILIKPIIIENKFTFEYDVKGIQIEGIEKIIIKIVSGKSSFLDFLVFVQIEVPTETGNNNLIMGIEETKTSDDESRNTGVYQRASKFAFISAYFPDIKLYMLYNDELNQRTDKSPSDTNIFGTNLLLTLGVSIVGKNLTEEFKPFETIDEVIQFKSQMRRPPASNIPIDITMFDDKIEISGRLSKPSEAGNIAHDPNIGALSLISKALRVLGWEFSKPIVITYHGVAQIYMDATYGNNKFLYICKLLNIQLADIVLPRNIVLPTQYWQYEKKSEKVTSIFFHLIAEYNGLKSIYENHAGCERGYFKTQNNELIALPKKDIYGQNLYIPDLILYSHATNEIILIEGKQLSTMRKGIAEIENYNSIEKLYINQYYPNCKVYRCVCLFGGNLTSIPHEKVILHLNDDGTILINELAPLCIKWIF